MSPIFNLRGGVLRGAVMLLPRTVGPVSCTKSKDLGMDCPSGAPSRSVE